MEEYIIDSLSLASNMIVQNTDIKRILSSGVNSDIDMIAALNIFNHTHSIILNADFDITILSSSSWA